MNVPASASLKCWEYCLSASKSCLDTIMFALVFVFPSNRYCEPRWGDCVNEARVPWPPEPWRVLHALVASYKGRENSYLWERNDLDVLISALAENPPSYRLPKAVVQSTSWRKKNPPVFDALLQLPEGERLVVTWPELKLNHKLFEFASWIAEGIGYLGRTERWGGCTATNNWSPEENDLICHPAIATTEKAIGNPARVIAPLSASDYSTERARLITEFEKRLCDETKASGKSPATEKILRKKYFQEMGPTLPELLVDALALEMGDYLKYGWNRPPASREVLYLLPEESCSSSVTRQCSARHHRNFKSQDEHTVARYLLAGRPLPQIEDVVKIGELMRLAALSKFGWETVESTGDRKPKAPSVISGRDTDGKPLRNSSHSHAFWLPEDTDGDGYIDHITVYAPEGLGDDVRSRLDRITRLWTNQSSADKKNALGYCEWRLALEGFGNPQDFSDSSRIFGMSQVWASSTPFLATGHLKKNSGYAGEVKRLLKRRKIICESLVDGVQVEIMQSLSIGGTVRHTSNFHRFRSQRGEKQTDTQGTFLRLIFPEAITGPISLGFACHFGLGLFERASSDDL